MRPFTVSICRSLPAIALLLAAACSPVPADSADRLTVMTFNVENLFDTPR